MIRKTTTGAAHRRHRLTRCVIAATVGLAAGGLVHPAPASATGATVLPAGPVSPAAPAAPDSGGSFRAIAPCRLADTREGTGFRRVDPQTIEIAARGACNLPGAATSLTLTLTVVGPRSAGFLTAWPADRERPLASDVNYRSGETRANASITRLDGSGAFRVFTSATADVVVDVVGAFVPSGPVAAGRFQPVPARRLLDTRSATRLGPGATVTLPVPQGVAADAVAMALNITLTEASAPGYVTVFPAGQARPTTSALNVDSPGQTRAAASIFPISSTGVSLFVSGGGQIVVDLVGTFTGASAAVGTDGLFTPSDPTRLLDTREAARLGTGAPLYPGGALELTTGRSGSMAYNITAVDGDPGYVTTYPAGTEVPPTSSVNSGGGGDVVANSAITPVSNRGLGVFSQARTDVVVDVHGWFSGPSVAATLALPLNTPPAASPASAPSAGAGAGAGSGAGSGAGAAASGSAGAGTSASTATSTGTGNDTATSNPGVIAASGADADAAGSLAAASSSPQGSTTTCASTTVQVLNAARPSTAALVVEPAAQAWACAWAEHMAATGSMAHSDTAARNAAVGCSTGENVAFASGTDIASLYALWFASPPHKANIENRIYHGAGIAFSVRTEASGARIVFGAIVFSVC